MHSHLKKYYGHLPIIFLTLSMTVIFFLVIDKLSIDRVQENVYLGLPYGPVSKGYLWINMYDPYLSNGPHTVIPPAFILYLTNSLKATRFYLFLFSIISIGLLYKMSANAVKSITLSDVFGKWLSAVISLAIWISFPLMLNYPLQTNGMMIGLIFSILGLSYLQKRLDIAILFFGCAAFSKGQFLAFFPAIVLYQILGYKKGMQLKSYVYSFVKNLTLFFSPHIVFGLFAYILGWLRPEDIKYISFQINTVYGQFHEVCFKLFKKPDTPAHNASFTAALITRFKNTELSQYGFLSWAHILFSLAMCVYLSVKALINKFILKLDISFNGLLGFAGMLYWLNFLFFWEYVYWYNVLAVLPFSIYFAFLLMDKPLLYLEGKLTKKIIKPVQLIFLLGFLILLANRLMIYHPFKKEAKGNNLNKYDWMVPKK